MIRIAAASVAWFLLGVSAAATASDTSPRVGVTMKSTDAALQRLYDAAEKVERGNIVTFTGKTRTLVEGGGYTNVWIETQPMGGAMYGRRNQDVAVNNQTIFMDCQREDGRLPGVIVGTEATRAAGWVKLLAEDPVRGSASRLGRASLRCRA